MKYVFMGTPTFAIPSLKALVEAGFKPELVCTQAATRRRRSGKVESSPVGNCAHELDLPLHECTSISCEEGLTVLSEIQPDLIVVVAFGQILSSSVLELPHYGCINLHPSMLPQYRGAAPIQAAVLDGVQKSGITIMRLVRKLDAGPILLQEPFEIFRDEKAERAQARAAEVGAEMMVRIVRMYAAGHPPEEKPQDHSQASYSGSFTKEQGLIHFDKPAHKVWDHIRGLTPWPRAYTYHISEQKTSTRVIVHNAQPLESIDSSHAPPGTIIKLHQQGVEVACSEGSILLTELQLENRPKRSTQKLLLGYGMKVGERFATKDQV